MQDWDRVSRCKARIGGSGSWPRPGFRGVGPKSGGWGAELGSGVGVQGQDWRLKAPGCRVGMGSGPRFRTPVLGYSVIRGVARVQSGPGSEGAGRLL